MNYSFEKKAGRIRTTTVEKAGAISERVVFEDTSGQTFFINSLHGHYDIPSAHAWFIRGNGISDLCALEGVTNAKTLVDFNIDQFLLTPSNAPKIIDLLIKIIGAALVILLIMAFFTLNFNPISVIDALIRGSRGGAVAPTIMFILAICFFALLIAKPLALRSLVIDDSTYKKRKLELINKIESL